MKTLVAFGICMALMPPVFGQEAGFVGLSSGSRQHAALGAGGRWPAVQDKSRDSTQDDLSWLVGKWRCLTREYLLGNRAYLKDPGAPLGPHTEDFLEYFNVYLPFADADWTYMISSNPYDRPIAAEFLVRQVRASPVFQETLVPMAPRGLVRIGTDRIWVGAAGELLEFKYRVVRGAFPLRMEIESKHTRIVLQRISEDAGDIATSFVQAPVRDFSVERMKELRRQYDAGKQKEGAR